MSRTGPARRNDRTIVFCTQIDSHVLLIYTPKANYGNDAQHLTTSMLMYNHGRRTRTVYKEMKIHCRIIDYILLPNLLRSPEKKEPHRHQKLPLQN